ncbi:DUF1499 domain-containing protein [Lyngbya sp. CCY1209]|jgi:uncharacterized protein (DUF1499 family)|uniref:DUF1499 domain-containing protein n=1 Tax=Lyngbya sp. CCY1209 TaxID=2886103 RepID=UPI002D216695|nr:DUF1499 domain-containing protein [Lyngbya sp. CCY1209]MEB3883744.1 DUF1499 domain-containing protein [Lyngbya sp. CCY1209]
MRISPLRFLKKKLIPIAAALLLGLVGYFGGETAALAGPTHPTVMASLFSFSGQRPDNLGVHDGHLSDCPDSPNCVSSESRDAAHYIEPFTYSASGEEALTQIEGVLENMDNATIVTADDHYIDAEFTSAIMGFVDDVEFYLDEEAGVIQVRSASRLGESDLGVNRDRIETIRTVLLNL